MTRLQFASAFRKNFARRAGDEDAMRLVQAVFHLGENDLPLIYERGNGAIKLHRLCNHSELINFR